MSGKATPTIQPAATGPPTSDVVNAVTVRSEGGSGVSIKQEDSTVPLHNGNTEPEHAEDADMGDSQGSLHFSLLCLCHLRVVLSCRGTDFIALHMTVIYFGAEMILLG